jgi:ankyrin repeat protein
LLKGVAVNLPSTTSDGFGLNYELEPPLHVAIRCFNGRQLIPLLLDSDADVNCSFRDVRPLGLAIYHSGKPLDNMLISSTDERIISRKDIVKQLIEKRADVNRRSVIDGIRLTPLQQARKYGLSSIERLLVENGAVERKTTSRRKVRREEGTKQRRRREQLHPFIGG